MSVDVVTLTLAKAYTDKKVANGGGSGGSGAGLPPVTETNNGNLLQVVNGAWAAVSLPSAEQSEF